MFLNARSIVKKRTDIIALVQQYKCDVIIVTETWLHEEVSDELINIPEFKVYRSDRGRNTPSGGVAVFIHERINSQLNLKISQDNFELVKVEIDLSPTSLYIVAVYRPDHGSVESCLDSLAKCENLGHPSMIAGDFNVAFVPEDLSNNPFVML